MSKTKRELYEDISKIFVENGIRSSDFAKLTELYRMAEPTPNKETIEAMLELERMAMLDEVIEFLVEESEDHSWDDFGIIELNILPRLRKKYGVK